MNLDKEQALDLLDQTLAEFDLLEKRIRKEEISEEIGEEYNELYYRAVDIVGQLISEDESNNFSQQTSVPSYELDPEEGMEVYHQSIVECIELLEDYRQKIDKARIR